MSELNSKAKAISVIVFGVITVLFYIIPTNIIMNITMALLLVFSASLYLIALEKKGKWISINWVWSALLLPIFSIILLIIFELASYPSTDITILALIFITVILPSLWILSEWVKSVFRKL